MDGVDVMSYPDHAETKEFKVSFSITYEEWIDVHIDDLRHADDEEAVVIDAVASMYPDAEYIEIIG